MRIATSLLLAFSILFVVTDLRAAQTQSALQAMKVLPKDAARNLARIEGRSGTPTPERWHFLVYDADAPTGLREYVVASNEIVAAREISQFAESLDREDVIGASALNVDTGKLARLAQQYADANNVTVASINYDMRKEGEEASPVWAVTCLDEKGNNIGVLHVSASQEKVVSREGFAVEPPAIASQRKQPKFNTTMRWQVAPDVGEDGIQPPELGGDSDQAAQREVRKPVKKKQRSNRTVRRFDLRDLDEPPRRIVRRIRHLLPF